MFNGVLTVLSNFSGLLYPWLNDIAIALVACLIVIFATRINRILRQNLAGSGFILRTIAFVLVNAFGYGVAIVALSPLLARQLRTMPSQWMGLVIVLAFIAIGAWAQRNNQV